MESQSDPGDRPRSDPEEPKVAASLDSQGNGQACLCLPSPWAFLGSREGFGFSRPPQSPISLDFMNGFPTRPSGFQPPLPVSGT